LQKKYLTILMLVLLASSATYIVAGFLVAPHMVRYWIENSIPTQPGRRLVVEGVFVNPFTLFISLTNVTLFDSKDNRILTVRRIETHSRLVEKLRDTRPGRDARIRDLLATDPSTDRLILTVPELSVTGLEVDVRKGLISVGVVRLGSPEIRITRDAAGRLHLPTWLPLWWNDATVTPVPFDMLEVSGGTMRFADHALSPELQLDANDIAGTITHRRATGTESVAVELTGRFGELASGEVTAEWQLPDRRSPTTVSLVLRRINVSAISPYFARIAGRGIVAGSGDLTLHYARNDTTFRIDNHVVVDGLQLSDPGVTVTGIELPLDLAAALLTDNRGRIDISMPALQGSIDADFDPVDAIVDTLTDHLRNLSAMPFDVLAGLVGRSDEDLGMLVFRPGSAEITAATSERIELLARALGQRPLLGLRAYPAYDPAADRDAIAEQQVRLHVDLATSAGQSGRTVQVRLDVDDPKVRAILDEFAAARVPKSQRGEILSRYGGGNADYYQAVYDALIANEYVSETALRRLARFRARSAVDALAGNGVGEERLLFADAIETTNSNRDAVVLRLEAMPWAQENGVIGGQERTASRSE
jgi:hypothetical protein